MAGKRTPLPKYARILAELMARRLTRFDAQKLGDSCLNSTVADLERRGVIVERECTVVPGFAGTPTHCKVYWIAPSQRARARALLEEAGQ